MKGKNKCKILKQIRQQIADENDIPYVTRECSYQGECSGTCPKCEAELRYLEQELEKRRRLGKAVTVAALAATISIGASGCVGRIFGQTLEGDVEYRPAAGQEGTQGPKLPEPDPKAGVGEKDPLLQPDGTQDPDVLAGKIVCPSEDGQELVVGEIAEPENTETAGEPELPELQGNIVALPTELEGDVAWIAPSAPETERTEPGR